MQLWIQCTTAVKRGTHKVTRGPISGHQTHCNMDIHIANYPALAPVPAHLWIQYSYPTWIIIYIHLLLDGHHGYTKFWLRKPRCKTSQAYLYRRNEANTIPLIHITNRKTTTTAQNPKQWRPPWINFTTWTTSQYSSQIKVQCILYKYHRTRLIPRMIILICIYYIYIYIYIYIVCLFPFLFVFVKKREATQRI